MKHIIVSRVNIPRELDPSNHVRPAPYKSPEWNDKRIELLNRFTRPSMRKQTCQDFTFVTLWGSHHMIDTENKLPNERQFVIRRGRDEYDEQAFDFEAWRKGENDKIEMDFAYQIRDLIALHFDKPLIITNCDSDDCLRKDFVEILQREAPKHVDKEPVLLDPIVRHTFNPDTGAKGIKARKSTPSPFTTSIETKLISVFPLRYHHSMMLQVNDRLTMIKIHQLKAMQTVTDTNILSQGLGNRDDAGFDIKDYF